MVSRDTTSMFSIVILQIVQRQNRSSQEGQGVSSGTDLHLPYTREMPLFAISSPSAIVGAA